MAQTVLIIDDHPSFRTCARALLEPEGFRVVGEDDDRASGVRKAAELRPDFVLLDVNLPDFDGFEVAARLSRLESPPAVVLTSNRDCADFGSLVAAAPARGFVRKSELSGLALAPLLVP